MAIKALSFKAGLEDPLCKSDARVVLDSFRACNSLQSELSGKKRFRVRHGTSLSKLMPVLILSKKQTLVKS